MNSLQESLVTTTKQTQNDNFSYLLELLNKIPDLEYELKKEKEKNVIVFTSPQVGFGTQSELHKNLTIDGQQCNCRVVFPYFTKYKYCYLNFCNIEIEAHRVSLCGKLKNVNVSGDPNIEHNPLIKNVYIKSNFEVWYDGRENTYVKNLKIKGETIRLNNWSASKKENVIFSCNRLEVQCSKDGENWYELLKKIEDVETKEKLSEYYVVKKDVLQKILSNILNVKFIVFPSYIKFNFKLQNIDFAHHKHGIYRINVLD